MLWCQGAQNIKLSKHKLKSALTCTEWSQCTPVPDRQTDRQTDWLTNITTIARRFVLTNASRAKNGSIFCSTLQILRFTQQQSTRAAEWHCHQRSNSLVPIFDKSDDVKLPAYAHLCAYYRSPTSRHGVNSRLSSVGLSTASTGLRARWVPWQVTTCSDGRPDVTMTPTRTTYPSRHSNVNKWTHRNVIRLAEEWYVKKSSGTQKRRKCRRRWPVIYMDGIRRR